MKKFNVFILTSLILISFIINITGCSKKPERVVISQGEVEISDSEEKISPETTKPFTMQFSTKCFVILFGYDFNAEDFVTKTTETLSSLYGLYSEGGLILPLVYPDNFKNGSKSNISLLKSLLTQKDICGILILGAPDGTGTAVSRITDSFGTKLPYPVFSCFSQDEVLSMEYQADIVIDKAMTADIDGMLKTEEEQTMISDIETLIENSINLALNLEEPLGKNADLIEYAKRICSPHKVSRWSDPDTGLYSINHFYIQ